MKTNGCKKVRESKESMLSRVVGVSSLIASGDGVSRLTIAPREVTCFDLTGVEGVGR